MRFRQGIAIILLVFSSHLFAADANNKFAMKGAGLMTCNIFAKERASESDAYYLIGGWVEGYISAHNKLLKDTYDVTTFESLELLLKVIDNHCQSNPADRLFGVVDSMIVQLSNSKIAANEPKVRIEDGKRKTFLYRQTIEDMQDRLASLGLYNSDIDGRFTDATQAALIAYQSDIEFEPTGFPDQATLWRLLR